MLHYRFKNPQDVTAKNVIRKYLKLTSVVSVVSLTPTLKGKKKTYTQTDIIII